MTLQSAKLILILTLALALVARSSAGYYERMVVPRVCSGLVGDCVDAEEEMGMESESTRRSLQGRGTYIGYGALFANRVPCRRRGTSYYNCDERSRVNPYRRKCSVITRCARILK